MDYINNLNPFSNQQNEKLNATIEEQKLKIEEQNNTIAELYKTIKELKELQGKLDIELSTLKNSLLELEAKLVEYQNTRNPETLKNLLNGIKEYSKYAVKQGFNVSLGQLSPYDSEGNRKRIGVPLIDPAFRKSRELIGYENEPVKNYRFFKGGKRKSKRKMKKNIRKSYRRKK
jgi:uncharacterized coiled-coil protein SlyX